VSTPDIVAEFYARIWNAGEEGVAETLLTSDFAFRGSLGTETRGRGPFLEYVRTVRTRLASYRCEVIACVSEGMHAFARMRFSGIHVGELRGFVPTGKPVAWDGAALFTFRDGAICDLWVLGDLAGLDDALRRNARGEVG
jgi:predicted ester cyclase